MKYSYFSSRDYTNLNLEDVQENMNHEIIRGACFSQQEPDTKVFPDKMSGVTFINCNLDNVVIPEGNKLIDCSNRRYKVQNDLNDWEIDENGNPVRLVNWQYFEKLGLNQPSPKDILLESVKSIVDYTKEVK